MRSTESTIVLSFTQYSDEFCCTDTPALYTYRNDLYPGLFTEFITAKVWNLLKLSFLGAS